MIDPTLTHAALLSMWERGEGQRPSRRALALLSGALPEAAADELAELSVGRRDAALLTLREQLFGRDFTGLTSCPLCGEEIELAFDAEEVRRHGGERATVHVVDGAYDIETRLPSTADLAAIENLEDLDAARERLFRRCLLHALHDSQPVDVSDLPPATIDAVAQQMAAADPQADVQLDVLCPACTHAWREPFDIVTFFWSELAVRARRLLGEVHELASAYGWSESAILALSPARRNAYLEMLR